MAEAVVKTGLNRKDFVSDQEVRWCPGCGDYAILAQMQKMLPEVGIPRENIVFVSGIGCSSRFPYYMNTYGIHSIHGRAPTIATGIKTANPDLSVWVITGDGDGLSIGGNHLLHCLRRNVDLKIILFNNRIYGLTKGQYSPTSLPGHRTTSTPMGSIDYPLNPISVALSAEATFVARSQDTNTKHLSYVLKRAAEHEGAAFVEIYQNCVVLNPTAWEHTTDSDVRDDNIVFLEEGQPLIFGKEPGPGHPHERHRARGRRTQRRGPQTSWSCIAKGAKTPATPICSAGWNTRHCRCLLAYCAPSTGQPIPSCCSTKSTR